MTKQIKKIVILGGGTAGLLSALALRKTFNNLDITLVRSTKIGVVGVGEGTIPSVLHFLHNFLGLERFEMFKEVSASPKLGIRYYWGRRPFFNYTFSSQLSSSKGNLEKPRGYYCKEFFDFADLNSALMNHNNVCMRLPNGKPKYNQGMAYHLENKKFVDYLERLTTNAGILKIDDELSNVICNEEGVQSIVLKKGKEVLGDLFLDCSGFRSEIIGKVLNEDKIDFGKALFCDRAVVGGWERTDENYHPYTTAETMNAGWCWRIEHDTIINRGYVYCSEFISEDAAITEFMSRNPKIENPKVIHFDSNIVKRSWVKNVIAIGNAAGFVEPLEATSIGMICDAALRLSEALAASDLRILNIQRDIFNRITLDNWLIIRDFLALHYKFNNRLDTPFWKTARKEVSLGKVQEYVDYYQKVGPDFSLLKAELKRDFFSEEGYLSMMVGQRIPYESIYQISEEDNKTWANFKNSLNSIAKRGFNVSEFLKLARASNSLDNFGMANKKNTQNNQSGELRWH